MIIPQMQQRWTGYSSEGSRSLLDGVLGARRAEIAERDLAIRQKEADARLAKLNYDMDKDKKTIAATKEAYTQLSGRSKQKEAIQDFRRNIDKGVKAEQNPLSMGFKGLLDMATKFQISPHVQLGRYGASKLGLLDNLGGKTLGEWYGDYSDTEGLEDRLTEEAGGLPTLNPLVINPYLNDPQLRELYLQEIGGDGKYNLLNNVTIK
tara:strand:+ start:7633 stop:8253 length:621 start_codon:yes stop_codon:yes gene_type:complete